MLHIKLMFSYSAGPVVSSSYFPLEQSAELQNMEARHQRRCNWASLKNEDTPDPGGRWRFTQGLQRFREASEHSFKYRDFGKRSPNRLDRL